ncbi:HAMP domain-containing histidine kinase [Fulvivirgaceae bacterium PWU4]|uniref:histidine kinase n=1 Tax=Chryseosolibacter histidini TaxID=2782349 RepID=A0AAP2GSR6_9BACT|nr:HAMP domain-containing sensor histidine kinase [Chryseosolibacter histidini]MBT1701515.1 HAMP domain-containing histidine kinase [Chryseosolibacter histidini]
MKLVNKFALWYLAMTSLVLLAGGVIVFRSVQHENDEEEVRRLRGRIEDARRMLKTGTRPDSLQSPNIEITEIDLAAPRIRFHVRDTMGWHSKFQGTERQIWATASYTIHGHHYAITAKDFAPEPEETLRGVVLSLSWIFFLLLVVVGLTSILISKKILSPFNQSLRVIQAFNLKQKEPIRLPETRTDEFKTLNTFLGKMTDKALHDYRALKEFTENASHELQTPLAIIRGKLELLLESGISDEQARLILSAHEAIERLSRINQSLTLLTKLENQEYEPHEPVNLSTAVHKTIFSLTELMEMKSIALETDIEENVFVKLHPALTDILLTNLFSNAIRHNHEHGTIKVKLNAGSLSIQNTGPRPGIPTEQLFQRFRKSNQSGDSIGLGLSIVKRISEVSRFSVCYQFEEPWHLLKLDFTADKLSVAR